MYVIVVKVKYKSSEELVERSSYWSSGLARLESRTRIQNSTLSRERGATGWPGTSTCFPLHPLHSPALFHSMLCQAMPCHAIAQCPYGKIRAQTSTLLYHFYCSHIWFSRMHMLAYSLAQPSSSPFITIQREQSIRNLFYFIKKSKQESFKRYNIKLWS